MLFVLVSVVVAAVVLPAHLLLLLFHIQTGPSTSALLLITTFPYCPSGRRRDAFGHGPAAFAGTGVRGGCVDNGTVEATLRCVQTHHVPGPGRDQPRRRAAQREFCDVVHVRHARHLLVQPQDRLLHRDYRAWRRRPRRGVRGLEVWLDQALRQEDAGGHRRLCHRHVPRHGRVSFPLLRDERDGHGADQRDGRNHGRDRGALLHICRRQPFRSRGDGCGRDCSDGAVRHRPQIGRVAVTAKQRPRGGCCVGGGGGGCGICERQRGRLRRRQRKWWAEPERQGASRCTWHLGPHWGRVWHLGAGEFSVCMSVGGVIRRTAHETRTGAGALETGRCDRRHAAPVLLCVRRALVYGCVLGVAVCVRYQRWYIFANASAIVSMGRSS
mmetsp:Transcript_63682/g.175779  ORF Transcript_63682/g.175779 Transcript_63682/m.175779 type:complete len:384 (+) Transcript_63682:319-1470(+)